MSLQTKEDGAGTAAIVLEQRLLDLPHDQLNEHGTGTLESPLPQRPEDETASFKH